MPCLATFHSYFTCFHVKNVFPPYSVLDLVIFCIVLLHKCSVCMALPGFLRSRLLWSRLWWQWCVTFNGQLTNVSAGLSLSWASLASPIFVLVASFTSCVISSRSLFLACLPNMSLAMALKLRCWIMNSLDFLSTLWFVAKTWLDYSVLYPDVTEACRFDTYMQAVKINLADFQDNVNSRLSQHWSLCEQRGLLCSRSKYLYTVSGCPTCN